MMQLNFNISNTDIFNGYVEVICKSKPLIFSNILPSISQIHEYLEDFEQFHLVQDNQVWLYLQVWLDNASNIP